MAEEKSAENSSSSSSGQKPILLIALAVINMIVVLGVGFMLYKGRQKEAAEPKIENVIKNEAEEQKKESEHEKELQGKVVPLETFIFNIAGSRGTRVGKVNLELELKGEKGPEEIDKRKANIRDIIIIILSSKTYDELSSKDGKEALRTEIKDRLNSFLVQGKVVSVFFTEFIYN